MCGGSLDGGGESYSQKRGGSTRGGDILPEGIAGQQFDVDLVQALYVSSCPSHPAMEGVPARVQAEGM